MDTINIPDNLRQLEVLFGSLRNKQTEIESIERERQGRWQAYFQYIDPPNECEILFARTLKIYNETSQHYLASLTKFCESGENTLVCTFVKTNIFKEFIKRLFPTIIQSHDLESESRDLLRTGYARTILRVNIQGLLKLCLNLPKLTCITKEQYTNWIYMLNKNISRADLKCTTKVDTSEDIGNTDLLNTFCNQIEQSGKNLSQVKLQGRTILDRIPNEVFKEVVNYLP
jgi:hypothetical protein